MKVTIWDRRDLSALLSLETVSTLCYRSRYGDSNLNGRSYGGQVLGQAMMAAAMSAPEDRPAASLQLTFLRGADPNQPIDFVVTALQDGRRFSSRHVLGLQGNAAVLSANATFATLLPGPSHQSPSTAAENPDALPELVSIPDALMDGLRSLGPYSRHTKECIDFRVPGIAQQLGVATAEARLRFWLRSKQAMPLDHRMQAATFAYLSDWWLNFSSVGAHIRHHGSAPPLYIASLNHCIWFHRPFAASEWMHVDTNGPCARSGRGLSIAHVHDSAGVMLATLTQESLMT